MSSFLDKLGLSHFWEKIKSYITQQIQSVRSEIPTELPNPNNLFIRLGDSGTMTVYDGSESRTVTVTPDAIGAASSDDIPSIPSKLPNPYMLTINYGDYGHAYYDGSYSTSLTLTADSLGAASKDDIPTELPNPHLLTIGVGNYPAITYYTYDGSKNVTLSINENTLKIFDAVYPVGSIYMSTSSTNPEYIFGGTWEQIQDMFLLAAGSKYEAGTTGGEATHTLTQTELPKISGSFGGTSSGNAWGVLGTSSGVFSRSGSIPAPTNTEKTPDNTRNTTINMTFGGGQAHNNMPPYLAVYVWKRVS